MSAYGRKGRVRKGPPKKKQKVSKIGARLQECIKEITSNSSHKAFFNNLLSQSSARSIKGALAEWDWEDMQVLEKALSCAFCGTRILTFMRIRNRITGATAIIGRDCYDKLVKLNAASEIKIALKSQKRVLRDLDSAFQTRVVQSLRTYYISLGSWKTWFSEMGKRLPRPMWRGLRSLNG